MRLLALVALGCSEVDEVDKETEDVPPHTGQDTDIPVQDEDGDGVPTPQDCDDQDATVYPGAPDLCGDDRVTDCDRISDDGLVTVDGGATFPDLQQALDAAQPGSEVLACRGVYGGPLVMTVPVHLRSHEGAEQTSIDGLQSGSAVTAIAGSTITGFRIQGGRAVEGGGIRVAGEGELIIDGCVVTDNEAGGHGGGIAILDGSVVTLLQTSVTSNGATGGGGIAVVRGSVELVSSTVSENTAAAYGGGVYLEDATLVGGLIERNLAEVDLDWASGATGGGGVAGYRAVEVTGAEIADNASVYGGGVSITEGSLALTDTSVHGNESSNGYGGGVHVFYAELRMEGTTTLFENTASTGGGLFVFLASAQGGLVEANEAMDGGGTGLFGGQIADMTILSNVAARMGGGVQIMGLVSIEGVENSVTGGLISLNSAPDGGGVADEAGHPDLVLDGVEISGNSASNQGGGLWLLSGAAFVLGGEITGNTALLGGGASVKTGGELSSQDCDWGSDAEENAPDDVFASLLEDPKLPPDPNASSVTGYGAGSTFSCTEAGCDPLP
jgi:hypothetical protein